MLRKRANRYRESSKEERELNVRMGERTNEGVASKVSEKQERTPLKMGEQLCHTSQWSTAHWS